MCRIKRLSLLRLCRLLPSLLAGGMLCACSAGGAGADDSARIADSIALADSLEQVRRVTDLTTEAEEYADSVLRTLDARQMAGMLFMPAVYARGDGYNLHVINRYVQDLHVGGLVLLKGDLRGAAMIADTLRALAAPAPFLAVDAENGLRMRFEDAPEFPWNRELGHLTDDQLLYEFGRELARECRATGINMVLGPVIDVVPGEGSHGLMRRRSLGSDPRRVADLALAYARGVEDGNVISVAKHFPGHGSASADSHRALGEIRADRAVIDSVDLYPFRRYVAEGLSGVMVGHLAVKALDSVRRPAVVSPVVMQDVLRGQLGFEGLVITDALNMEGAMGVKGWQAVKAGADMVIAPSDTRGEITALVEAMRDGRLDSLVVADRCRRILFYKYLIGQDHPARLTDIDNIVHDVHSGAEALRDSIRAGLYRHMNSNLRR
jgi:beta-glucosidase-like glycosyl hydrolase